MKKLIILLLISTLGFGQNLETQFKAMIAAFNVDPAGNLQSNATEDFYFINGLGQRTNKKDLVAGMKAAIAKMENTFSNVEYRDLGTAVTATGSIHQEMVYKDGSHKTWDGLFTYVYQKKGNEFMVSSMHHTDSPINVKTDEAAIKAVIEGQTQASYDRNLDKALSFWAQVPYASAVYASLNANLTGFEQIKSMYTAFIKANPKPSTAKIKTDYNQIKIQGNAAFVKHTETFTSEKGIVTQQNCHRNLERINGEWKLVGSFVSPLLPSKANDEAAIKMLITAETQAYIDGDGKKLISYWADKKTNESASQSLIPYLGQPYAKGESMEKLQTVVLPNLKKQDIKIERDDFEIRINKDMAWATYTQKVIANGSVAQSIRETRILERINGEWKIVYVGEQVVK